MHIAILGRQPALGIAELESCFGSDSVDWFSDESATIKTDRIDIELLGGSPKSGLVSHTVKSSSWRDISNQLVDIYSRKWSGSESKITLGISAYGFDSPARDIQRTGIILKQNLKKSGVSLRLIPNQEASLNTAVSHHNKLGLSPNKVELLVVKGKNGQTIIAESTGSQNISALARRDQGRPKRDALVGMLPPKLAQIMINLATGHLHGNNDIYILDKEGTKKIHSNTATSDTSNKPTLLDPFCGTGVVLQEAALMGYRVYGTDKSEKMVEYSKANINWLKTARRIDIESLILQGDATTTTWESPISAVACETYLGQAFSRFPGLPAIERNRRICGEIISGFLANIAPQLRAGTPICIAMPEWYEETENESIRVGSPIISSPRYQSQSTDSQDYIDTINDLGFDIVTFKNIEHKEVVYRRPGQVVARSLAVFIKR